MKNAILVDGSCYRKRLSSVLGYKSAEIKEKLLVFLRCTRWTNQK